MSKRSILTAIVFLIFLPIYKFIQKLIWNITGIKSALDARVNIYERSVHVQKVRWTYRVSHVSPCNGSSFWTTHEGFCHPDMLRDKTISLYGISATEVFFIKSNNEVDIYKSDTHPFMTWAQTNNADKLYVMPMDVFHKYAAEIGDPKHPVVWLSSIGRCGSTLLCQVFEEAPGTLVLSEPEAVTAISICFKSEDIDEAEYKRCLKSIIQVQCKPIPGITKYVVKLCGFSFHTVEAVYELFPSFYHIFMYRQIEPYLMSMSALSESDFALRIFTLLIKSKLLSKLTGSRKACYKMFRLDREDTKLDHLIDQLGTIGMNVGIAAGGMQRYKELYKDGFPIHAVKYEDLLANKFKVVQAMFQKVDIPEKYVQNSLSVFEKDSQRGSMVSKKSTGQRKTLTQEDLDEADLVLDIYGFPKSTNEINLPGSL